MPNIKDPFDRGYQSQGPNDLIATLNHVAGKAEGHEAFQGGLPEYISLPSRLRELAVNLGTARDSGNMAAVHDLTTQAVQALDFNADHLVRVSLYRNNPSLLQNGGYDFKAQSVGKTRVNLLDLVPEITLKHLEGVSGAYVILVKRPRSTASVEFQTSETPDVENSWRGIGEGTFNKARTEIRGCEPTKRIYVRGRYHEDGKVGHWSAPVSIIIL